MDKQPAPTEYQLSDKQRRELIHAALAVREQAYAPYSHFAVGAALLAADGRMFTGCNVENAAFTPGLCAERAAFAQAVAAGCRDFAALAVVGAVEGSSAPLNDYTTPCGVCRQWLVEFCPENFPVIAAKDVDDYRLFRAGELLPYCFSAKSLVK